MIEVLTETVLSVLRPGKKGEKVFAVVAFMVLWFIFMCCLAIKAVFGFFFAFSKLTGLVDRDTFIATVRRNDQTLHIHDKQ